MDDDKVVDILFLSGYLAIIILRICNIITWSWLWVLCPLWLPVVGVCAGLIIGGVVGIIIIIYEKIRGIKNEKY